MDVRLLREQTRAEHEATEALMPLSGADLTREQYAGVLRALLPIVESWERWAHHTAPEHLQPLLATRRRSHLLRADLLALGAQGDAAGQNGPPDWSRVGAETTDPGSPEREAAFLGSMYVMEGSTLGGRFLARHVEAVLGLEPGKGDAYFQGHGELTGSMWREVTAALGAVPESCTEGVVAAARMTFTLFGEQLQAGLAPAADTRLATHG